MAGNAILELNGITGESKVEGYVDKGIDIEAYSWSVSNNASAHSGGGASGGGVGQMSDVNLTKYLDAASTVLAYYSYSGDHIDTGTLHIFESGGKEKVEYLKLEMTEIYVTSLGLSGHGGAGDKPMENVSLACSKIVVTYTQQSETGGQGQHPKVTIDAKLGKAQV